MMEQTRLRRAVLAAVEKLQAEKTLDPDDAVLDQHGGDLRSYVEQAARAAMTRDVAALKRALRDAQSVAEPIQLEIPGLEHAAIPAWVEERATGRIVAMELASIEDIDWTVSAIERAAAVRNRIAAGYRATVDAAKAAGAQTGADVLEMFRPAVES